MAAARHPKGTARRYAAAFGAALGLGLVALVALNWAVDPLQFLRRASFPMVLSDNQRFQNPGLVRNYDYDTLVIGSSLMQPFRKALVDGALGGSSLRVVTNQATSYELRLLLEVALRTGKPSRVVRDIHVMNYIGDENTTKGSFGDFPYFLYDESRWNDLDYLVNFDTLALGARAGLARLGLLAGDATSPDKVGNEWLVKPRGAASVRASHGRLLAKPPALADVALPVLEANLRDNLIAPIAAHPDVAFVLFVPPYSAAWYDLVQRWSPTLRDDFVAAKMFAIRRALELPNARVYDFQCWYDVILDAERYADVFHFSSDTAALMLAAIAEGRFEVTLATIAGSEACMRSLFDRSAELTARLMNDAAAGG